MRAKLRHPLFGEIDPTTAECWEATVPYLGRRVRVDLNLEGEHVEGSAFKAAMCLVEDLAASDRTAREAMQAHFDAGDEWEAVHLYMTHHARELRAADLERCFGTTERWSIDVERLLAHLHLARVGIYPQSQDACALLDYSISKDLTQYVLVVGLNAAGHAVRVDMES